MTPSVISIFVSAVSREFGSYRREIASALRERGYHTKVQEEFNTGPGTLLEKLEAFIKRCDAVICLIGDGFGAEPRRSEAQPYSEQRRSYTQLEYLLARKHGKPVYVFFPSGPDTPRDHEQDEPEELLALQRKFWDDEIVSQGIDRTPFSDRAGLVRAVLVCDLPHAGRLVPLGPVNVACPYVGLKRFDGKDRDYFYGRTHAVDRVREHVRRAPLVLLTGNSGSGKSSLVRAGVIPAWVEEQRVRGYRSPRAVVFTPGSAPFERLWAALSGTDLDDHAVDFVKTAGAGVFRDLMERLPETDGATQPWFFFIDQFEEIFTRMGDREKESRESFVAALVDLAERQEATETAAEAAGATVPEVRVVLAMRDDFFGNLRDHRKLFAITDRNLERVVAMENEELREAIEMPAARHGVRFESGLVDRLIRAVEGRAGMLPMLQFTLEALWLQEKERGGIDSGILTIESYREIGGVEGALQKRVSHYYGSKTPDERKAIRNIFLSLVEPDMGSEFLPVSRAAQKEMLVSIGGDRILRELLDKEKLLISEGRENESVVELAHEALIKGWTEFASWVTDCKEAIRIRNQLREDSRRWASAPAGLADDELWRGSRLERALELERSGEFERIGGLAARDRQFIEASEKLKHKEIRKARLLAGTASVVAIVALALAVVAFDRTNAAKEAGQTAENHLRQARLEIARAWLERARRFHNQKDFFGSALMAAKGLGFAGFGRELGEDGFKREHEVFLDPGLLDHDETAGELGSLVRESSLQIPFWKSGGHRVPITALAWNPAGEVLASGDRDGHLTLWHDWGDMVVNEPGSGASQVVRHLSWSPDGRHLVAAFGTEEIRLFEASGKLLRQDSLSAKEVADIAWRSDGRAFAVGFAGSEEVRIYAIDDASAERLNTGTMGTLDLDWMTPSLTIAGKGGAVKTWIAGHDFETALESAQQDIYGIGRGAGGELLAATRSANRFMRFDGEKSAEVGGPASADAAALVGWSPTFESVAEVDAAGALRLWSRGVEVPVEQPASGPCDERPLWSPDGAYFASCTQQGVLCIWDASGVLVHSVADAPPADGTLCWKPSGASLCYGSTDGAISQLELPGKSRRELAGHRSPVVHVAWNPDSTVLASVDFDGSIKLFRHPEGRCFFESMRPSRLPPFVAWNKQGDFAAGHDDGIIEIRDGDGKLSKRFGAIETKIVGLSWDGSGDRLAVAGRDGSFGIWRPDGTKLAGFEAPSGRFTHAEWSPDAGELALGGSAGHLLLWRLDRSESRELRPADGSEITALRWSPCAPVVAVGFQDGYFEIWNRAGPILCRVRRHSDRIADIAWTPDGKHVATSSWDNSVKIWNADGSSVVDCHKHDRGVPTIAWSPDPDGKTLASGSWDGFVVFWDLHGGIKATIDASDDAITRIAWNPDGTMLATASGDRRVRVFCPGISENLDLARFLRNDWLRLEDGSYRWQASMRNPAATCGWRRLEETESATAGGSASVFHVETELDPLPGSAAAGRPDPSREPRPWHFPDSDRSTIVMDAIRNLTEEELWEGRNEIFARKGLIFGTSKGKAYMAGLPQGYYFPASIDSEAIESRFIKEALDNITALLNETNKRNPK